MALRLAIVHVRLLQTSARLILLHHRAAVQNRGLLGGEEFFTQLRAPREGPGHEGLLQPGGRADRSGGPKGIDRTDAPSRRNGPPLPILPVP